MSSSWTAVAGSWGVVSVIIVLGWYYYSRDGGPPKRSGKQAANGSIPEVSNDLIPKSKKQKKKSLKTTEVNAAESENNSSAKSTAPVKIGKSTLSERKEGKDGKSDISARSSSVDPTTASSRNVLKETDTDIKEFARQMVKAKDGTSFSNAAKESKRIRTQKQSKVNGFDSINGGNNYSSTSSNTGGDADDDLSSVNSPGLSAITSPADISGVSDMLESPGPGPVALRITEPLVPTKPKTTHVSKPQVTETKKQRQNRLKREREKEANREAEAQRKVLEERQRRTAREAEGRPAKNGNGWTYSSGLPANAWSGGKPKHQPLVNVHGGLLDTMEHSPKVPTIIDDIASTIPKSNSINGHTSSWNGNLPSEEEQLRLIQGQSEESEWTTVSQPKRTKRKHGTEV